MASATNAVYVQIQSILLAHHTRTFLLLLDEVEEDVALGVVVGVMVVVPVSVPVPPLIATSPVPPLLIATSIERKKEMSVQDKRQETNGDNDDNKKQ